MQALPATTCKVARCSGLSRTHVLCWKKAGPVTEDALFSETRRLWCAQSTPRGHVMLCNCVGNTICRPSLGPPTSPYPAWFPTSAHKSAELVYVDMRCGWPSTTQLHNRPSTSTAPLPRLHYGGDCFLRIGIWTCSPLAFESTHRSTRASHTSARSSLHAHLRPPLRSRS